MLNKRKHNRPSCSLTFKPKLFSREITISKYFRNVGSLVVLLLLIMYFPLVAASYGGRQLPILIASPPSTGTLQIAPSILSSEKAKKKQPFFVYVPYTQTHEPVDVHPDFKGKTGNGSFADVPAQTYAYVGELLEKVDELGLKDNTIFIFTSDNGREGIKKSFGFTGPLRGAILSIWSTYFPLWPNLPAVIFRMIESSTVLINLIIDPKEEEPEKFYLDDT